MRRCPAAGKPLLLVYEVLLTQVFGQLMVGVAPLLKQYFLPAALTFALILSVPSSGGAVTPDLLPTPFRYLSGALPLAQAVKATPSVAYFDKADLTPPTLLMLLWVVAITAGTVAIAWRRQSRTRPCGGTSEFDEPVTDHAKMTLPRAGPAVPAGRLA